MLLVIGYWEGGVVGDEFNRDMVVFDGDNRRKIIWGILLVWWFFNIEDVKEDVWELCEFCDLSVLCRFFLGLC